MVVKSAAVTPTVIVFAPAFRVIADEGEPLVTVTVFTVTTAPLSLVVGVTVTEGTLYATLSVNMLKFAREKAAKLNQNVTLEEMDIQSLEFADNTFDSVVASLVFCSVPDPMQGLSEIRRVLKPGGKAVLLEHVISSGRVSGAIMNFLNPLVLWTAGDNINRHSIESVAKSGLTVEKVSDLTGIFKLIEARKSPIV